MIDLTALNDIQKQAVLDTNGNVLVFAGAGSGKTRVLTYRIANIIDKGLCYPDEILAITFTNKAANEMKERLSKMIPNLNNMWVCTIHSMCTRILRRDIDKIGYESTFTIYSDAEKTRLVKNIVKEKEYDEEIVKKCLWAIGDAKSNNLTPDQYEKEYGFNKDIEEICDVFREYENRMMFSNALDFDDLLIKTKMLLSTNEEVRDKYSSKFKYIHIDEFQDTNEIQYEIVKLLSKNNGNLFIVGDDDQSIYGFRGAKVANILNFAKDFDNVKTYKLEQNYRSTKKILQVANEIISKNMSRADKKLWCDNENGDRVEYHACYNETEEGSYVAGKILSLTTYSGYKNSEIAVLYRMNSQSRSIEQEFLKYNIPFKVFGGQKFYDRKEIKDLTAYIRAVVNPKDFDALSRIINIPKRGIGETTISKLNAIAVSENMYFYELLENIEKRSEFNSGTKGKIANFRNIYFNLISEKDRYSPLDFVNRIIDSTEFMTQFIDDSEENISRIQNIGEFRASVKEFSELNPAATIADFLESITLSSTIDEMGEDPNVVTLATVHAVKGLEFKVIFVIGLDEGVFPIVRATTTNSDFEEERRLMYVAVTRAMERLFLTHCDSRYSFKQGERTPQMRSRFIEDIKTELGIKEKSYEIPKPKNDIFIGGINSAAKPQQTRNKEVFKTGDIVEHKKFGIGTIISTKGNGEDMCVDVAFKGFGVKTLVVKYAPLQKK